MKKQQFLEVIGYCFVALVFITIFTWIFHIFMAPNNSESFLGDQTPQKDKQIDVNTNIQRPYVTREMDMGDFEGDFDKTMTGKFEGGIQATKDIQNLALRQYPFDWANAPPSSKIFQEQNALFLEKQNLIRNAEELPADFKTSMDESNERLIPPIPHVEKEGFNNINPGEDIIKDFRPRCSIKENQTGNKFSDNDSENFILDYYDKLGLVPEFKRRDDGVYEVTNTYEKNPKIEYEDDGSHTKRDVWKPMSGDNEVTVNAKYSKELNSVNMNSSQLEMSKDVNGPLNRIFGPGLQWQQYG